MLRKLRLQFILIASLAVTVVLLAFIGVLNSAHFFQNEHEISSLLTILNDNQGEFPEGKSLEVELATTNLNTTRVKQMDYFSYQLNTSGDILSSDFSHIQSVTAADLEWFLEKIDTDNVVGNLRHQGYSYSYQVKTISSQVKQIVVLDTTVFFSNRDELLATSFQMTVYSLLFFIVIVFIFSSWAIKPYVENVENQKRFITNAGHELKTPLAIISANTEMQELLDGETEWSKSTGDQVVRMTELINRMITLAKLEEQPDVILSEVNMSAIVQDAAEDFKSLAMKHQKEFELNIQPDIMVKAEEQALFELVTILVDNATKYCDPNGKVSVQLSQSKLKRAILEVSNTYQDGKNVDYSKFFDRFYREDESHNRQVEGYGIGLSMAQSLVRIFKGKLTVYYKKESITFRVIL